MGNAESLKHLLSSAKEQKVLKAHKNRCKPVGIKKKIRNLSKWDLDLTHKETIKRLKRLHNEHDDIDWAIFDFKKHTKYLIIPDDQYGTGGSEALSKELAKIDQHRYAVLSIVYGHIVKHRLILLIIWNPLSHNVMIKKEGNNNKLGNGLKTKRGRHYSQTTTVIFWQHKDKIKAFANAKKEMNINLHSKLAESMIISQLHRDGLLDDIIIRVTKTSSNDIHSPSASRKKSKYHNPVKPMPFPRQWTLKQLKECLCKDYKMKLDKIKISMVPNIVNRKLKQKRKRTFSAARNQSQQHILLEGDEKTLFELGIDHGSQIYITDQNINNVSNATIKQNRLRALDKTLQNAGLKSLGYKHRREQSMPTWL